MTSASLVLKRPHSVIEVVESATSTHKKIRIQTTAKSSSLVGKLQQSIALLENVAQQNSKELLEVLVKIADELVLDDCQLPDLYKAIKKLLELFRQERDGDTTIRVKILRLLADLAEVRIAEVVNALIDEIIAVLKHEKSQKVIAQGLSSLHKIGARNLNQLPSTHVTKIAHFAQQQLISESHHTQKNALLVLSAFVALTDAKKGVIDTVGHYADSQDSGVRAQSLRSILCLGERGAILSPNLYQRAVDTLEDDYECVRKEALRLVFQLGVCHPDYMISCSNDDEEEMRLIDAAFSKVCGALCDLSIQIRVQAAKHLGDMTQVSSEFLHQTLDKKLMSNLRRKKTAHERGAHLVASGEWSSGKRWGDDAPQEQLDTATISLIASGACGALVHGLEDEFMEVRIATVDSMCKLALRHPDFAVTCLDFLVDMFNDEIEEVRLKAIYSLTAIAKHIVLREDQLEIMLSSLEDFSVEVREGLHLMLGACRVSTQACLLMVVQKLLDVLAKYPQDKFSAFGCMRKVGQKHANLCMAVTSHLLQDHPFFDSAERDVEDPAYLCILILLFNAAQNLPPIISLFPYVTLKHYAYLRDAMPTLVPELPIEGASSKKSIDDLTGSNNSREYLETILAHINEIFSIAKDRVPLLKTAQDNLKRLGEIDPEMLGTANFLETFLAAQIQIEQLQSCTASQHNRAPLKESLAQLVRNCLKLQHVFSGLTYGDILLVKQICLRASALHLVLIVRDRSQSALGPCQMLLQTASDISSFLDEKQEFQPDDLTTSLLNQLGSIVDPKPGRVFREILPLVQAASPVKMPPPNVEIKMCVANILEPCPQMSQDNVIKVTAGLIAALPFVAEIDNLQDAQKQDMRIKIKYPDQHTHTVVPKLSDFRKIMTEQGAHETNVKLRTTILLSHSVWTEASSVEITLCLAVRPGTELELCKPAKILFAPKPVRRGI
ncbi:integrator complex subunit 4-like [Glossina fuscipes]|uniref:Integrator complex subunit 4-like n=1 Tax=Glossina fuscipes TaxID=7396 RepID=A0A9C6E0M3_9MUSC|nr:integrator complex subunit 4-like [Glossina fuscipes]XP_037899431.1 integrator complex subunit 4-like [Glossina fuscipes]XP_037899510.1 integrator complex subunit 4-like [Glossina fuscipes]